MNGSVIVAVYLSIIITILRKPIHIIDDSLSGTDRAICTFRVSVWSIDIVSWGDWFAGISPISPSDSEQTADIARARQSLVAAGYGLTNTA